MKRSERKLKFDQSKNIGKEVAGSPIKTSTIVQPITAAERFLRLVAVRSLCIACSWPIDLLLYKRPAKRHHFFPPKSLLEIGSQVDSNQQLMVVLHWWNHIVVYICFKGYYYADPSAQFGKRLVSAQPSKVYQHVREPSICTEFHSLGLFFDVVWLEVPVSTFNDWDGVNPSSDIEKIILRRENWLGWMGNLWL